MKKAMDFSIAKGLLSLLFETQNFVRLQILLKESIASKSFVEGRRIC